MEIKLKGSKKALNKLLKSNSTWMKRKGIEVAEGKSVELQKPKLTANEVAELIGNCKTIDELKQYESDTRQVVENAYKKKLKELE